MSEIDHIPHMNAMRMAGLWFIATVLMVVDIVGTHLSMWPLTGPLYYVTLAFMLVLVGIQSYGFFTENAQ